ncbi:MAG: Xaa-Pro peptidase family protein [Ferruginibacter sp.]
MTPRIEKLQKIREIKNIDTFLVTSGPSLKYFSGYFYNFETGPSPFHLLPAALVVGDEATLIIADNESCQVAGPNPAFSIKKYESYVYEKPIDATKDFLLQLHEVFKQKDMGNGRVGIEQNYLPYSLARALRSEYPKIEFVDITQEISRLKAVKDSDEINYIRAAANLADIGQAAALQYAKQGMTELELFSMVRLEMETQAGTRIPMMTDLVCGTATASGGGNPTTRIIQHNDLVLTDLTPCFNGYWGDSCSTIVVGTPTKEQGRIYELVKGALEAGIASIRPGVLAKDIDLAMRNHLKEEGGFGHHGGHGVGTFYHEEPRIVPYNAMILEPGMVIALEPAIYKQDYGIRLEHLMLVTNDGCDILTNFKHSFEQR